MGFKNTSATRPSKVILEANKSEALELRKKGYSFRQIADALGSTKSTVFVWVKEGLEALAEEQKQVAAELRQLELERIDVAFFAIANAVRDGDLSAIDRWEKLIARRCKLLGLDSPQRREITGAGGGPLTWQELVASALSDEPHEDGAESAD